MGKIWCKRAAKNPALTPRRRRSAAPPLRVVPIPLWNDYKIRKELASRRPVQPRQASMEPDAAAWREYRIVVIPGGKGTSLLNKQHTIDEWLWGSLPASASPYRRFPQVSFGVGTGRMSQGLVGLCSRWRAPMHSAGSAHE